ncbi:hypothetical protein [Mesorhizobium sp. M1380]
MAAEARREVLESGNWLTAPQIATMAGFSTVSFQIVRFDDLF